MNILEEIPKTSEKLSSITKMSSIGSSSPSKTISSIPSQTPLDTCSPSPTIFDNRIVFFVLVFFFSILLAFGHEFFVVLMKNVRTITLNFFDIIGNVSGKLINTTTDVTADAAHLGIDLTEGAVKNAGNILIGDEATMPKEPRPDSPEDTIQKNISSTKTKWCLAGEYENKRGCIAISDSDKCMSEEVYPTREMCINPTLSK